MITIKILDIKTFLYSHVVWLIHDMLVRRINQSAVLWFVRWIRTWKGPISRKPRPFLVILKVLTSAFRYLNFCVAHFKVILTLALRNRSYSITNSSFWIISIHFLVETSTISTIAKSTKSKVSRMVHFLIWNQRKMIFKSNKGVQSYRTWSKH